MPPHSNCQQSSCCIAIGLSVQCNVPMGGVMRYKKHPETVLSLNQKTQNQNLLLASARPREAKPRRRHEKKGRGSGSEEANPRGAVLSHLESTTPRSVHSLAREWGVLRNISRRINLLFSHRLSSCQNISVQPTLTLCVEANGRPKKRSSPNTP